MPQSRLKQLLRVTGGLALAAPALVACDAKCGACCAAAGNCSAYSDDADKTGGCGAATSRDAMMEES